jgi:hypothetical protein
MPDTERYPHLFLPGPTDSRGFTSPQQGGGGSERPERDRAVHAAHVAARLEAAFETDQAAKLAANSTRDGTYLSFLSEPGFDLELKSLEQRGVGIRLLNVREIGDTNPPVTQATVYIPKGAAGHFLQ